MCYWIKCGIKMKCWSLSKTYGPGEERENITWVSWLPPEHTGACHKRLCNWNQWLTLQTLTQQFPVLPAFWIISSQGQHVMQKEIHNAALKTATRISIIKILFLLYPNQESPKHGRQPTLWVATLGLGGQGLNDLMDFLTAQSLRIRWLWTGL